jgi:Tfp pilus assembly protein PilZ
VIQVSTPTKSVTTSRVSDIGLGGVFVFTDEKLHIGEECVVNIELIGPASLLRVRVEGEIVRAQQDGVGVQFTRIDTDSLIHLKHILSIHAEDPDLIKREYFTNLLDVNETTPDSP